MFSYYCESLKPVWLCDMFIEQPDGSQQTSHMYLFPIFSSTIGQFTLSFKHFKMKLTIYTTI